jgi:integrase
MPIKLVPPRPGKTPYWSARGTYLGQYVDRSTKARRRAVAAKIIKRWEWEIENDQFARPGDPTFASAALAYMKKGGERRFLTPIIEHFGNTPLAHIDQATLDSAAVTLYPDAGPATLNRNFFTPAIAVLHSGGVSRAFDRPEGASGRTLNNFLWAEQVSAIVDEAAKLDLEFAILLLVLYYCGLRLSEALQSEVNNLRLKESFLYISHTKNEEPRGVFLPKPLIAALRLHPRGLNRPGQRIFKFHKGGHIYSLLRAAAAKAGVDLPERQAFHIFCHTYATLLRRHAKLDLRGLVGTGRWKDIKSTFRYAHAVASEEARRASLLPPIRLSMKNES